MRWRDGWLMVIAILSLILAMAVWRLVVWLS